MGPGPCTEARAQWRVATPTELCLSRRWLHCEFKQPGSKVLCPSAPASKSQAARAVEPQYQDPRKGAPQWLCAFQRRRTAASCTTGPNQQSTILSDHAKQHNGRDSPRVLGNLTRIASVENSSRWQPSIPGLKLHRVTPMIISLRDGNRHWDWIRT